MFKIVLIFQISVLFFSVNCSNSPIYKTCENVPFCQNLRNHSIFSVKYKINSEATVISNSGQIKLQLEPRSGNGKNIILSIDIYKNRTFRIRSNEIDEPLPELPNILEKEPSHPDQLTIEYPGYNIQMKAEDYQVWVNLGACELAFYYNNEEPIYMYFPGFDSKNGSHVGFSNINGLEFYGIPQHADNLALKNTMNDGNDPYRLKNLNVEKYELNSRLGLHGSVPVLFGHGSKMTFGIFSNNPAEHWIDISNREGGILARTNIMIESGPMDIFITLGPQPQDAVRQYTDLTGKTPLPQLWTLGYHQSSSLYTRQTEIDTVVTKLTTNEFPFEAIWLDGNQANDYDYFTWNSKFPNPIEMQENLALSGKKLIVGTPPQVKVDSNYSLYNKFMERELLVKQSNGSNLIAKSVPGPTSFIDFLNPEASDLYGSFYSYDNFVDSTEVLAGIWTNMNEPLVLENEWERTLPNDAKHYNNLTHNQVHNLYSHFNVKSIYEGLLNRDRSEKRPFVLSSSHFAGSQRYSAINTGENSADWDYLANSYSQCLNANLVGLVFCGADVGGTSGNPSEELLQRWYQAGAWLPFFRAHSNAKSKNREPYLFSNKVQDVIRNAIQLRYQHLSIWYTLFYQHSLTGDPVIRPLFYQYPTEYQAWRIDNQLLLGSDILVRAITEAGVTSVPVYFPGGSEEFWFSIDSSNVYLGKKFVNVSIDIDQIPVFYKSGSVIARKDTMRLSAEEMVQDPYTLYVNLDSNNQASGFIYIDNGTNFDYLTKQKYNYLKIDVDGITVTLTKVDELADSEGFDFIVDSIIIHRITEVPKGYETGVYEKTVYKNTQDGFNLKTLKIGSENSLSFTLF